MTLKSEHSSQLRGINQREKKQKKALGAPVCGRKENTSVLWSAASSKSSTVSTLRPYLQAAVGRAELMGPAQPLVSAVELREKRCETTTKPEEEGGGVGVGGVDREREGRGCQTVVSPGAKGTGEWRR